MGSCFSSRRAVVPTLRHQPTAGRELLPEPEEEEEITVKEVLSETSVPASCPALVAMELEENKAASTTCTKDRICCNDEKRSSSSSSGPEGGGELKELYRPAKYLNKRSFSGEVPAAVMSCRRETGVGIGCKGMGMGSFSSPLVVGRRPVVGRTYSALEVGRRQGNNNDDVDRRSAVKRNQSRGRSVSAPRRMNMVRNESSPRIGRRKAAAAIGGDQGNELLENPLVSLECFIFI